jgi:hypothetical protein
VPGIVLDAIFATVWAAGWAAIPFWTRGLTLGMAEAVAAVIFPAALIAYALITRGKAN